ncbi:MAG: hemolysin [Bacteroidetes bacterium MED-G21]|nr:MAG: hemolysin [Bacteroidetes bacterium MED-G21]
MDPDSSLLTIILSLLFSAFFSGMEIAFIASNKLHIELMKKRGEMNSRVLSYFLEKPSRFIATMLVGNNIALVVYGVEMANILEPHIQQNLTNNDSLVLLAQTVISTLIVLVTAEFIPKVLFSINANRLVRLFAVPAALSYFGLYFFVSLIVSISKFLLKKIMRVKQLDQKRVFGRVDLKQYIKEHATTVKDKNQLEPEIQIFQNALDFSSVKARECMVPRNEIVAMEIGEDINKLTNKFVETGFSKILIFRENIDQIIGYTHSYELFKKPKHIKSILLPIALVPETMKAGEILNLFIKERKSIALVIDEFGGTSGLLTIEDIIEEIFGDIKDEHDPVDHEEKKVSENKFIFSGRHEIDYLNEKYNLNLPESDYYETLSGLIVNHCESIPQLNEQIKVGLFVFEILEVNQTRIEKVKLFWQP